MLGTCKAILPNPAVRELHLEHPDLLLRGERFEGDRNIYSSATKTYLTNLKNHLRMNIKKFVSKAIYSMQVQHGWNAAEITPIIFSVLGWSADKVGQWLPMRQAAYNFVQRCRTILALRAEDVVDDFWLRQSENTMKILNLFVYLARVVARNHGKRFKIVPIASIRRHFITIDNSVLEGLLSDVDTSGYGSPFQSFDTKALTNDNNHFMKELIWRVVFDVDRLCGQNKTFSYNVQTDGVSMCVHYTQPKRQNVEKDPSLKKHDLKKCRVLGLDPGRVNIYYIVDVDDDGNTKRTYKLTRGQYYRLSGCHLATKQGIKWCDNVRSALELFSMTTTKTVDMDDLLYYFEVYMRVEQQLWGEFLRARWSGKRLRTYVARNVSWQTFSTP
jgi:hypothetical protein